MTAGTPRATYRLQLHGLGLRAAADLVPYLARLGVSHLYVSPVLRAAAGSTHGYDVVDPRDLDPALGEPADWQALVSALHADGMGMLMDIVPNHMAITEANPYWWDVLENGRSSRYAHVFDVDWDHPEPALRDTILMPILGDQYGRILEAGELRLVREGPAFLISYHEHRLPVTPRTIDSLLRAAAGRAGSTELAVLADAFGALPGATDTDATAIARRDRDSSVLRAYLGRLLDEEPTVGDAVDAEVGATNGDADALDALLERQQYRLALWRAAGRDLGYRRFFDVTTLAGVRVEDSDVFEETHARILELVRDGSVDGLRIDHVDGLRDPAEYLSRLARAVPDAWLLVEKILASDERLRPWPVAGTTGYEALGRIDGLFVDPDGEAPLLEAFRAATGEDRSFDALAREARIEVLREGLGSELNRVTALGLRVLERHRRFRDHTRHDLHESLREIAAAFPVYRTYVRPEAGAVELEDADAVARAVRSVRETREDLPADLLDFLRDVLSLRIRGDVEGEFAVRFQQLSGAVMAKGVEDTAFYRYAPLLALCEVGGDPARFGTSPDAFHAANAAVAEQWPLTMLAGSTHDTKRSEDARHRLAALSEMPREWLATVARLHGITASYRVDDLPDGHAEWLLWQTLLAAWPIDADRLTTTFTKSLREAKLRTSWTHIDEAYERGVMAFARSVVADPAVATELQAMLRRVDPVARTTSLAALLLRLTAPGVPDIYQGTELWDHSLVDPDNRRPVDFAVRSALLTELEAGPSLASIQARADEGLPKLWVAHRALALRRARPDAFDSRGAYRLMTADGARSQHVVAYGRGEDVVVIVPRLVSRLTEGRLRADLRIAGPAWKTTKLELPPGFWRDHLAGTTVSGGPQRMADLLPTFPVALFVREAAGA